MPSLNELLRELLVNARKILVWGSLAAAVAAGVSFALPLSWESVTTLLPPERRTDSFHYRESRVSGFRRMLESLRLKDRAHPVEVHCAILTSEESARRLVDRLGLRTRWNLTLEESAFRRLERAMHVEAIEYGGIEVRVRTGDAVLSAEIANGAATILEERLAELYHGDLDGESGFVRELLAENLEQTNDLSEGLAAQRIESGLVDPESQEKSLAALTKTLVKRVAAARTEEALAIRKYGRDSGRARDAVRRAELLALQAGAMPSLASDVTAESSEQAELKRWERATVFLRSLENQILEAGSQEMVGVRVLDSAIPAERPDLTPVVLSAVLAFLAVPAGFLVRRVAASAREALLAPNSSEGGSALAQAIAKFLDGLRALPFGRARVPVFVTGAAAFGLVCVRTPLVLTIPGGLAFFVALLADLEAAWLLLAIALPWAWDYMNWDLGFEIQIPTEPGIILFVVLWSYSLLRRGRLEIPRGPLVPLLFLTLAWIGAGIITSYSPRLSFQQFVTWTGLVLVGSLYPILEIRRLETIERVLKIYIVSGALLSIYGLTQVMRSELPLDRAAFFMGEGLLHTHGPFTAFIGYGLGPCLVYLLTGKVGPRSTPPLVLAATLMLVATVVSLTRAAWVSVALLLALIALARLRHFVRRIVAPLALASLVLVPVFFLSPKTSTAFREYLDRSVSTSYGSNTERLNRWRAGARMFLARPLTGVGPGVYATAYDGFRDAAYASQLSDRWMGAHSDLVRTAAEQGLPGLAIFVALVAVFYRSAYRLVTRGSTPALRRCAAAISAGAFTYTVHGLLNEYSHLPKMAFTFWIFVGLLGALDQIERTAASSRKLNQPPSPS